jgi:hypothetical protein
MRNYKVKPINALSRGLDVLRALQQRAQPDNADWLVEIASRCSRTCLMSLGAAIERHLAALADAVQAVEAQACTEGIVPAQRRRRKENGASGGVPIAP